MLLRFPQASLIALAFAAGPALAQDGAPPADAQQPAAQAPSAQSPTDPAQPSVTDTPSLNEIVVIADRIRGQVDTTSPPVIELDERQVASYGASSIADLVAQLAPEIGAGRGRGGRPVFLVNGQRISSFREMGRYPPESIRKVEVLPEEVALRYGYPADQRVINFILKDNFASREIEAEYGMPTAGGYGAGEIEASLLTINGPSRLNASVDYTNTTSLTEAERGIVQTPGSVPTVATDPNPAAYRTLVARASNLELNLTRTTGLGEGGNGGQFTLNGQVAHGITHSLSGLDIVTLTAPSGASAVRSLDESPIERRTQSDTYSLGSVLNKPFGKWQLSTTLDASRSDANTMIDRRRDTSGLVAQAATGALAIDGSLPSIASAGTDESQSTAYSADLKSTLIGSPFRLPGGDASLTINGEYAWNRLESTDTRIAAGTNTLTRGDLAAGATLSLPITSTREGFGEAIGDLTLTLAGGVDHLSDFGSLWNYTTGLVWKPVEKLGLQATYIVKDAAPGLSQLGGPVLVNYNVPTYDFRTGQTVLITTTSGGNPDLVAEKQRDLKLSASYDLGLADRSSFLVEYYRNRSANVTSGFPLLTSEVEAAFPARVTRAADGTLLAIDARPVTFAETASERIRYGFNVFGRVGKPTPQTGQGGRGGSGRFGVSAVAPPVPSTGSAPAAAVPGSTPGTGSDANPGGGQFDPARFAEMRAKFCATPDGQTPDLAAIPDRMLDRLKDENGQIDPAKVAALKARFCAADGAPGGPRRFDSAQFAQMRTALACDDADKVPDIAGIPQEVVDRLKRPDGTIDPARLTEFKTRICALPAAGNQPGEGGGRGGEGRGPVGGDGGPSSDRAEGPSGGGRGSGGGGGGGPGGLGRGGDGQGRWNLSLYHTVNLTNRVTIAQGGPVLDLLGGDATGSGGGVSRHQLELEGGLFYRGIGTRLSGRWSSATTVLGSGLPGSDLRFGDIATFDLRMFVALDQQKWLLGDGDPGFWKGTRLSLRVNNLFDAQQRVTDGTGTVPLRYQPGLLDPTGRFFEIELRKVF